MTILDRLLSALGLGGEREDRETRTPTVTVEHDPDASDEAAVKGVDAGATGAEDAVTVDETEDAGDDAGAEAVDETDDTDTEAVDETDDADTEAVDEDATDARTPDGASVETLKGIGPAYAGKLEAAGVETVSDLADADADDLAERTSLSAKRIGRWIERARERRDA